MTKTYHYLRQAIVLLMLPLLLSSCGKKEEPRKEKPHELGKYLYLSDDNVLHTEKNCIGMFNALDEEGHEVNGIRYILTYRFISDPHISYCKWCFDEEYYEKVMAISTENKYGEYRVNPSTTQSDDDLIPPSRRQKNDSVNKWEKYKVK